MNTRPLQVGDTVTRIIGFPDGIEMKLKITAIDSLIHCGDWTFSLHNGAEIDLDLDWTETRTGSYLKEFHLPVLPTQRPS